MNTAWNKLSVLAIFNLSLYVSQINCFQACCGVRFFDSFSISLRLFSKGENTNRMLPFLLISHVGVLHFALIVWFFFDFFFGKIRLLLLVCSFCTRLYGFWRHYGRYRWYQDVWDSRYLNIFIFFPPFPSLPNLFRIKLTGLLHILSGFWLLFVTVVIFQSRIFSSFLYACIFIG